MKKALFLLALILMGEIIVSCSSPSSSNFKINSKPKELEVEAGIIKKEKKGKIKERAEHEVFIANKYFKDAQLEIFENTDDEESSSKSDYTTFVGKKDYTTIYMKPGNYTVYIYDISESDTAVTIRILNVTEKPQKVKFTMETEEGKIPINNSYYGILIIDGIKKREIKK